MFRVKYVGAILQNNSVSNFYIPQPLEEFLLLHHLPLHPQGHLPVDEAIVVVPGVLLLQVLAEWPVLVGVEQFLGTAGLGLWRIVVLRELLRLVEEPRLVAADISILRPTMYFFVGPLVLGVATRVCAFFFDSPHYNSQRIYTLSALFCPQT